MSDRPLVLLHPLGSGGAFWDDVLPGWQGQVLAMDLPGHGSADLPPAGSGIGPFVDTVVAKLEGIRSGGVDVVGVSLGGLVALELAARHPALVDRLVLVDTVATYPQAMRQMWGDRAATARSAGLEDLADPMATMWFSDAFRQRHPETVANTRQRFMRLDPEGYARTCEALEAADTRACVPAIEVPTLVVCGSLDLPPFKDAAVWLQEQLPDAELLWLEGAKHASIVEQPEQFRTALAAFLG